ITSPAARATGVSGPSTTASRAATHSSRARAPGRARRSARSRARGAAPSARGRGGDVHRQLLTPPGAAGVALAAPSRPIDLPRHRHGPLLRLVLPVEGQRGIDVLALLVDAHDVIVHPPPPPSC